MITLTRCPQGNKARFNPRFFVAYSAVRKDGNNDYMTNISLANGLIQSVEETPEQIDALVEEWESKFIPEKF